MPAGWPEITCRPKIASGFGFSSAPSSTISGAPPVSPGGGPSSAGWKMNLTVPGTASRTLGQRLGHAHQDRDMRVVSAGMHHADLLAEVLGLHRGLERQVGFLDHRQGIHVGAQRHHRSRLAALEQADHAGFRDAGFHFHAELAQMVRHPFAVLDLAVRELRILVGVAPPVDDLGFEAAYALVYRCREVLREGGTGGGDQRKATVASRRCMDISS